MFSRAAAVPRRASLGGNLSVAPQIWLEPPLSAPTSSLPAVAGLGSNRLLAVRVGGGTQGLPQPALPVAFYLSPYSRCDSVANTVSSPARGRGLQGSLGVSPSRPPPSLRRAAQNSPPWCAHWATSRVASGCSPLRTPPAPDSTWSAAATAPWPRGSRGPGELARGRLGVVVLTQAPPPQPRPSPPRGSQVSNHRVLAALTRGLPQ